MQVRAFKRYIPLYSGKVCCQTPPKPFSLADMQLYYFTSGKNFS